MAIAWGSGMNSLSSAIRLSPSTLKTTLPGMPTTTELGGIAEITTELAPMRVLSPIFTGPKTFAPAPITTLLPIVG